MTTTHEIDRVLKVREIEVTAEMVTEFHSFHGTDLHVAEKILHDLGYDPRDYQIAEFSDILRRAYVEPVGRFRLIMHEELPEDHKSIIREHGDDPDHTWSLVWSFNDKEKAIEKLAAQRARAPWWQTWRVIDNGEADQIVRWNF